MKILMSCSLPLIHLLLSLIWALIINSDSFSTSIITKSNLFGFVSQERMLIEEEESEYSIISTKSKIFYSKKLKKTG